MFSSHLCLHRFPPVCCLTGATSYRLSTAIDYESTCFIPSIPLDTLKRSQPTSSIDCGTGPARRLSGPAESSFGALKLVLTLETFKVERFGRSSGDLPVPVPYMAKQSSANRGARVSRCMADVLRYKREEEEVVCLRNITLPGRVSEGSRGFASRKGESTNPRIVTLCFHLRQRSSLVELV
jgi:hypothetical protein